MVYISIRLLLLSRQYHPWPTSQSAWTGEPLCPSLAQWTPMDTYGQQMWVKISYLKAQNTNVGQVKSI